MLLPQVNEKNIQNGKLKGKIQLLWTVLDILAFVSLYKITEKVPKEQLVE